MATQAATTSAQKQSAKDQSSGLIRVFPPQNAAVKILLLLCNFLCPLLFFTDLTRNPYFTQIAVLNIAVLAVVMVYCWSQPGDAWRLPQTPVDAVWIAWIGVCIVSAVWSYTHHAPFFHESIYSESKRVMAFTIINTLIPFYVAATYVSDLPAEADVSPGTWAGFAVAWGALWVVFHEFHTPAGPVLALWPHIWDSYGALVWAAGLAVAARLIWKGTVHHYWHLLLMVGFLSSVYGVCEFFNTEFIWPKVLNPYGGRAVSTFGNPNFMSTYMVVLIPLALTYYLTAKKTSSRIIYGAVFLALEACICSSLTRSSWAGAAAALACLALSRDLRRSARENLESHGLLAVAAVAMVLLWPQSTVKGGYTPGVLGRISELKAITDVSVVTPYSPLYQRVLIWSCAWAMGHENPLLGKGWGVLELFYPFYQGGMLSHFDMFRNMRTHANNAHNEILEIFSQTGIAGLGVQFWLWVAFFAAAWKWFRSRETAGDGSSVWILAALAGLIGMLVDNMLNVSLHFAVPAFLFWWQAGIVAGRPAHSEGANRWREFRFPAKPLAAAAAAAVSALCLLGCWSWVCQWEREAHYFLGFKLVRSNAMPQAIDQLEQAHHWHPREVNANYELGNAYARSDMFPKAVWAYGEALKSNAGYDEIYFNAATVMAQRLGQWDEALKYFLVSYAINPLSPDLYTSLGSFYLREPGKYREECIELLKNAVHYFPDNTNFLNNLGYLYRMGKEYDKAEDLLSKALFQNPDFELAERNLREIAKERGGNPNPALREVDIYHQVEARIGKKDYSEATLEMARKAVQAFPKSMKAHFYVGNLEMVNGHPDAALTNLEPLVGLDPRNVPLLQNMAEIYLRLSRLDDARRTLQSILDADPQNAYAKDRLAKLASAQPHL